MKRKITAAAAFALCVAMESAHAVRLKRKIHLRKGKGRACVAAES